MIGETCPSFSSNRISASLRGRPSAPTTLPSTEDICAESVARKNERTHENKTSNNDAPKHNLNPTRISKSGHSRSRDSLGYFPVQFRAWPETSDRKHAQMQPLFV